MNSSLCIALLLLFSGTWALQFNDKDYHPVPSFLKVPVRSLSRSNLLEVLGPNKYTPPAEANTEYWLNLAREEINKRINEDALNNNEAKNVILFVANGMSLSTGTAARIRKGQLKGNTGEEDALSWEKFPYMGLSKTYCTNAQIGDSACTATAYLSGIKTNMFTLGVTAKVNFNNCTESADPLNQVNSLADWAQRAGKASGFITTGSVTHASSAALYAHAANRFWESDNDVDNWGNEPSQCMDIAQQLITQKPGNNFDLIMGGGMSKFLPQTLKDLHGNKGQRLDNKNLLSLWQGMHPQGIIVRNRQELLKLNTSKTSHIMGLFSSGPMDFHLKNEQNKEPSLLEMTEVAINYLSKKSEKGYFLLIDAAQIDRAHHLNLAGVSLDETLLLEQAVQKARDMTNAKDTLIVMSSDHASPLSISGYPGRGTNILGINQHDTDINGLRYATLNYAAGPQQYLDDQGQRLNIEDVFGENVWAQYSSYIHTEYGVHAGDDVGVFASGPHAHLFRGVSEQHAMPHLMAYAACIGDGPTKCDNEI